LDESANEISAQLTSNKLFTKVIIFKDTDDCTVLKSNVNDIKQEDLMYVIFSILLFFFLVHAYPGIHGYSLALCPVHS
jgi:hypothetical protein